MLRNLGVSYFRGTVLLVSISKSFYILDSVLAPPVFGGLCLAPLVDKNLARLSTRNYILPC